MFPRNSPSDECNRRNANAPGRVLPFRRNARAANRRFFCSVILPVGIHLRAHNLPLVPLKIKKNVLIYRINEELLIFFLF